MTTRALLNSKHPQARQQNRPHLDEGYLQEKIRQRAFELYEQRGRNHGHHEEDWAQAEQQIRSESDFDQAA